MRWSNRDVRKEPPKSALVGSVLVHGVVGVLAIALSLAQPEPMEFITYEIEMVSPPPAQAEEEQTAAPVEELEIETPDRPEPEPEETPPPEPDPDPEPEEVPPEPETQPEPEETPPETEPDSVPTESTTPEETEETEETGEDIEVRMEGLRRDFPQYYGNIVTQIGRCWSRLGRSVPNGLTATVDFVITADGTVTGVRMVERSGSALFDGLVREAIGGCASGRFGPLPRDLGYERLPIRFEFRPPGQDPAALILSPDDA
ncbi:MAG TPA: TonB C-terminal domain-containing protein [Longimicrobiales bacterium]|nr:TonB C-terminal domain-containing protein [Longimicrobiales bacterium]